MAKAPVPVTADMSIKVPVNLNYNAGDMPVTLIFTSMYLMYLMIHFLCRELKKLIVSEKFFKFNNYLFSTGTATTNKLDDGIPVTHF